MELLSSAQDYLETILLLTKKNGSVRSVDVASEMGFSKPSISVAMKKLKNSGYVSVEEGSILLTDKGRAVAEEVFDRHSTIRDWLIGSGVDAAVAAEDACRMEHIISEETFAVIKKLARVKL